MIGALTAASMLATLSWVAPAGAVPGGPSPDSAWVFSGTDPVVQAVEKDEAAFNAAVFAVEPYLVETAVGTLDLKVPATVRARIPADIYAAMVFSVDGLNELALESDPEPGVSPAMAASSAAFVNGPSKVSASIPGAVGKAILKFVKKNWKAILKKAKASGKWAWYKYGQCLRGAVNAIWANYGVDIALLVTDKMAAVATAGFGCIRAL